MRLFTVHVFPSFAHVFFIFPPIFSYFHFFFIFPPTFSYIASDHVYKELTYVERFMTSRSLIFKNFNLLTSHCWKFLTQDSYFFPLCAYFFHIWALFSSYAHIISYLRSSFLFFELFIYRFRSCLWGVNFVMISRFLKGHVLSKECDLLQMRKTSLDMCLEKQVWRNVASIFTQCIDLLRC